MILQNSKLASRIAKTIGAAVIASTVGLIAAGTASAQSYKYDRRDGHWLKYDERDRHWVPADRGPRNQNPYYGPRTYWNDGYYNRPRSYYYPSGGGHYHYHSGR